MGLNARTLRERAGRTSGQQTVLRENQMNTVTINNKQLPEVEYRGQRVVTLKMIDEVHQRPEGTARKRF